MPYIGKSPVGGGFHKLDNLTASATDTYALTLGGAAYYPETANQLLVSLNGVIQAPQDSFTVSGSNLIFDSALTASDSIDFVVALGDVLGVGSVTDGAVTTAKIGNNAVTSAKLDTNIDIAGTLDSTGIITADAGIKLGTGTDILNSFEEGTWTPTNTAGVTLSVSANRYQRIGNLVFINAFVNIPSSTNNAGVVLGGVPYAPAGSFSVGAFNNTGGDLYAYFDMTGISIRNSANNTRSFAELSSKFVAFQITYYTTS